MTVHSAIPSRETPEATWLQVNAWVLRRQGLLRPQAAPDAAGIATAVSAAGCIQAQHLPSARAAVALRAAAPLSAGAFDDTLRPGGTLLRTWLMRGTMHLVTPAEWPEYVAAVAPVWEKWHRVRLARRGLSAAEQEALLDQYRRVFAREDRPLTREELGQILSRESGRQIAVSEWGGPVRLLCYRGELVCGPPSGNRVTFNLAKNQLASIRVPELPSQEAAVAAVLTRYLRAFGPATAADFRHWTGLPATAIRPVWQQALDSGLLAIVAVRESARKQYFMLAKDLPAFVELCGTRRDPDRHQGPAGEDDLPGPLFLPRFDNLLLAYADKERLIDREYAGLVFRPVADVSATILDRGRIVGTWKAVRAGRSRQIAAQLFAGYESAELRDRVEAAVSRFAERTLLQWNQRQQP
jgi:hypothetical protein